MKESGETDEMGNEPLRERDPGPFVLVVGLDGSESSSRALAWAAAEARLRHGYLRVVRAWHLPTYTWGYSGLSGFVLDDDPEREADLLRHQLEEVLGRDPDVPLETVVQFGQATQVILDAAKGARMIVVGSRGRGGFAGLLLGSISSQLIHHASCPVTIVR